MSELLEIQRDLAGALRDPGSSDRAGQWLSGGPALLERRLAIYRANVAASAAKALVAAYPVLCRVVGELDFDGLARAYQNLFPSTSGDLFDYGAQFAEFLAQSPYSTSWPYLADLARLEWAVHRAYGAGDAKAWDQATLGQVAPARQAGIRFDWAAGTAIVDSKYPVVRIWQIHQSEYDGEFSVAWNASECALVAREGFRVGVSVLDAGDAAFIAGSLAGAPLGACVEAALAVDPAFDLGRLLSRAVARNIICGSALGER